VTGGILSSRQRGMGETGAEKREKKTRRPRNQEEGGSRKINMEKDRSERKGVKGEV